MKSKIVKLILIFAIILTIFNNLNVYAITNPLDNPDIYNPGTAPEETELLKKAGHILGVINTVGVVLSVIILMIIGLKYMLGSVEGKAEYKKTMIAYIIGAMLLFGVTTIANIFYKIGTNL